MVLLYAQVLGSVVVGGSKFGFLHYPFVFGKYIVFCDVNKLSNVSNKIDLIVKNNASIKEF